MRFRELELVHFGALTGAGPRGFQLGAVNVVCGPNEAGKSTFAAALETLLFGFDPATRDAHPLWQWDGGASNLEVAGLFVDRGGQRVAVRRVLQSSSRLFFDFVEEGSGLADVELDRKHRTGGLPHVQGVDRKLYRALWNLELGDFQGFDAAVQADIDALILPTVEGVELRPTRQVLGELGDQAKQLWRPDKRGKSRTREFARELKDVRAEIQAARARVDELRGAQDRRPALDARLDEVNTELARLERAGAEAVMLGDVAVLLAREERIGELRLAVAEPLADPRPLLEDLGAARERRAQPETRLEQPARVLTPVQAELVQQAPALEAELAAAAGLERDLDDWRAKHAELVEAEAALEGDLAKLLDDGVEPSRGLEWLRGVSIEALEAAHATWRTARERPPLAAVSPWRVIAGLALLAAATVPPQPYNYILAGVGLVLAWWHLWLVQWASAYQSKRRIVEDALPPELDRVLGGRVAPAFTTFEGVARLIVQLQPLVKAEADVATRRQRLAAQAAGLGAGVERLRRVNGQLPELDGQLLSPPPVLDLPAGWDATADDGAVREGGSLGAWRAAVAAALEDARAVADVAGEDARERGLAERERAEITARIDELEARLAPIRARLVAAEAGPAGGADGAANDAGTAAAFERWQAARESFIAVQASRTELDDKIAQVGLGRLADFEVRAAALAPEELEVAKQARERQREELEAERTDLLEERGQLQQLLKGVETEEGVAELMDQERELEERLAAARREHDRLRLLQGLLRAADMEWRADHEPDVLKRAGEHLAAFTGGRYTKLMSDEDETGARRLEVVDADGERRVLGAPLSRGTRDQVHLALRIALIDHLDQSGERLPLVLDEVLVHWDAERRKAIYAALAKVAETRQVFLMTCHDGFAREASEHFGVEPLKLSRA